MFGRKKSEPPTTAVEEPKSSSTPSPDLEFSNELLRTQRGAHSRAKLSDIDFSDLNAPKVLHDGEWKPLQLYTTEVTIILSNITFRGGWYVGWGMPEPGKKHWYESLLASAQIQLPNKDPLLTFYDWGDSEFRPKSGARYTVEVAEFRNTSVRVDGDFESKATLAQEERTFEDYFYGSPSKLFATPKEADDWIKSEVMIYSDHKALYKEHLEAKGGRPQAYTWPDIVFSWNKYREYSDDRNPGFTGSDITVPEDVYAGLRRAIVDFREGARVKVRARMEMYGMQVHEFHHAPFPATAELSIVPRSAQLAGKLMEVEVVWDDEVRPINSPGRSWTDTDGQD
jgi:hypothetical protein